jgi:signal peptidase II
VRLPPEQNGQNKHQTSGRIPCIEVNVKKYISMYAKLLGVVSVVVALDQWTKWLVRENIPYASQWLPESLEWLMPYARIVHWNNTGAAFGLFQNGALIFTVLAFVVIGAILVYYPQIESEGWMFQLALGLQMSGALGNLIDRLMHDGKVTDFISVGTFPVFNVADSSITIGTAVLILGVWLSERKQKQEELDSQDDISGEQIVLSEE